MNIYCYIVCLLFVGGELKLGVRPSSAAKRRKCQPRPMATSRRSDTLSSEECITSDNDSVYSADSLGNTDERMDTDAPALARPAAQTVHQMASITEKVEALTTALESEYVGQQDSSLSHDESSTQPASPRLPAQESPATLECFVEDIVIDLESSSEEMTSSVDSARFPYGSEITRVFLLPKEEKELDLPLENQSLQEPVKSQVNAPFAGRDSWLQNNDPYGLDSLVGESASPVPELQTDKYTDLLTVKDDSQSVGFDTQPASPYLSPVTYSDTQQTDFHETLSPQADSGRVSDLTDLTDTKARLENDMASEHQSSTPQGSLEANNTKNPLLTENYEKVPYTLTEDEMIVGPGASETTSELPVIIGAPVISELQLSSEYPVTLRSEETQPTSLHEAIDHVSYPEEIHASLSPRSDSLPESSESTLSNETVIEVMQDASDDDPISDADCRQDTQFSTPTHSTHSDSTPTHGYYSSGCAEAGVDENVPLSMRWPSSDSAIDVVEDVQPSAAHTGDAFHSSTAQSTDTVNEDVTDTKAVHVTGHLDTNVNTTVLDPSSIDSDKTTRGDDIISAVEFTEDKSDEEYTTADIFLGEKVTSDISVPAEVVAYPVNTLPHITLENTAFRPDDKGQTAVQNDTKDNDDHVDQVMNVVNVFHKDKDKALYNRDSGYYSTPSESGNLSSMSMSDDHDIYKAQLSVGSPYPVFEGPDLQDQMEENTDIAVCDHDTQFLMDDVHLVQPANEDDRQGDMVDKECSKEPSPDTSLKDNVHNIDSTDTCMDTGDLSRSDYTNNMHQASIEEGNEVLYDNMFPLDHTTQATSNATDIDHSDSDTSLILARSDPQPNVRPNSLDTECTKPSTSDQFDYDTSQDVSEIASPNSDYSAVFTDNVDTLNLSRGWSMDEEGLGLDLAESVSSVGFSEYSTPRSCSYSDSTDVEAAKEVKSAICHTVGQYALLHRASVDSSASDETLPSLYDPLHVIEESCLSDWNSPEDEDQATEELKIGQTESSSSHAVSIQECPLLSPAASVSDESIEDGSDSDDDSPFKNTLLERIRATMRPIAPQSDDDSKKLAYSDSFESDSDDDVDEHTARFYDACAPGDNKDMLTQTSKPEEAEPGTVEESNKHMSGLLPGLSLDNDNLSEGTDPSGSLSAEMSERTESSHSDRQEHIKHQYTDDDTDAFEQLEGLIEQSQEDDACYVDDKHDYDPQLVDTRDPVSVTATSVSVSPQSYNVSTITTNVSETFYREPDTVEIECYCDSAQEEHICDIEETEGATVLKIFHLTEVVNKADNHQKSKISSRTSSESDNDDKSDGSAQEQSYVTKGKEERATGTLPDNTLETTYSEKDGNMPEPLDSQHAEVLDHADENDNITDINDSLLLTTPDTEIKAFFDATDTPSSETTPFENITNTRDVVPEAVLLDIVTEAVGIVTDTPSTVEVTYNNEKDVVTGTSETVTETHEIVQDTEDTSVTERIDMAAATYDSVTEICDSITETVPETTDSDNLQTPSSPTEAERSLGLQETSVDEGYVTINTTVADLLDTSMDNTLDLPDDAVESERRDDDSVTDATPSAISAAVTAEDLFVGEPIKQAATEEIDEVQIINPEPESSNVPPEVIYEIDRSQNSELSESKNFPMDEFEVPDGNASELPSSEKRDELPQREEKDWLSDYTEVPDGRTEDVYMWTETSVDHIQDPPDQSSTTTLSEDQTPSLLSNNNNEVQNNVKDLNSNQSYKQALAPSDLYLYSMKDENAVAPAELPGLLDAGEYAVVHFKAPEPEKKRRKSDDVAEKLERAKDLVQSHLLMLEAADILHQHTKVMDVAYPNLLHEQTVVDENSIRVS